MKSTINIIGRGNVGSHLYEAFSSAGDRIKALYVNPRTLEGLDPEADFTLISVTDSAIGDVAGSLPQMKGIVAHTSGSVPMDLLDTRKEPHGVFYPLQTFTKGAPVSYREIPFFIEGSDAETGRKLSKLAHIISDNVSFADSEQRRFLHVASVFSCNFVNHLFALSDEFLAQHGMEFSSLLPLIGETIRKAGMMSPADAQTGPAARGDQKVIESHLLMLEDNPRMYEIYRLLSESIQLQNNRLSSKI